MINKKVLKFIVLMCFSALMIYPFILLVFTSLKTPSELTNNPIGIPNIYRFENYAKVFFKADIVESFINSVIITFFSLGGQVIFGSLAAYALTRMRLKRSELYFSLFLIPLIFSIQTVIVPLFIMFKNLSLLNSLIGVILIHTATGLPLSVFIYSKFMKEISFEITEAAFIDGASHFRIYSWIILPLVKSATITIVIINGLGIWNDFFVPLMFFTNGQLKTLPLTVFQFTQQYGNQWELISVTIIYTIVPALIVYMLLQKHIIRGVAEGSVKG